MKDKFVITNVSPFFPSVQDDSKLLSSEMKEKYSGINCTFTFKRVIDLTKKTIEKESMYMHHGNTNPKALKAFEPFVEGVIENGKHKFLDSNKIVKGTVIEMMYSKKNEKGKFHLVPADTIKIVGFMKLEKVKKVEDKVHTLF